MPEERKVDTSAHPLHREVGQGDASSKTSTVQNLPKDGQFPAERSDEERRALHIRWVILIGAVLSIIAIAIYIPLYFQIGIWQLLVDLGGTALGLVCLALAHWSVRRGKLDTAGYWVLLAVTISIGVGELVWAGETLYFVLGGIFLIFIAGSIVLPHRWQAWLWASGLYLVYISLVNRFEPWPRHNFIAESTGLFILDLSLIILLGLLALASLWRLIRVYQRIVAIRTRLLIAFVAIVVLTVIGIFIGAGVGGMQSDRQQALDRLEMVATLKEVEINTWIHDLEIALYNVLDTEDATRYVNLLLSEEIHPLLRQEAHRNLQDRFRLLIVREQRFEELFLLDNQGRVILSSDVTQEGEIHRSQAYFQQGLKGTYVQPPFYSPSADQMSVIFARPVVDNEGNLLVLVGRASMAALNKIMLKRAGLGETGEAYLIGHDHALLTGARSGGEGVYVHSQGANTAIESQRNGSSLYENYQGQTVVGAYRWLPELQVALLAEQGQEEAFLRQTYAALKAVGVIALVTMLIAAIASLAITRSIVTPLSNLMETATQITAGDLVLVARVEREDEIGALARAFNRMTAQLRGLISTLEQRVADRTRDLERRSLQLQAAAEVGRIAASMRDLEELLPLVTYLISERFGFYHVGVFLLDEAGEYAVLRAANSKGGQQMLSDGHRLKVGEQGIVGYVTGRGEPRIALDVGQDAVHFKNPYLPHTRSEMALPLVAGGQLLGALDVQSTEEAAFTQEDITVLQVLADQVAVAIESARLFTESQEALEATRRAYGELSREGWGEMLRAQPDLGFRCDEHGVINAKDIWRPEMEQALREGRTIYDHPSTDQGQPMAVPIKVRGQVVGVLDTYKPEDAGVWIPEEVTLLETITEQLGVALESARLFEETVEERDRTNLLLEVSQQLSADMDFDAVVETVLSFAPRLGAEAAELYVIDIEDETFLFKSTLPERASLTSDEARNFGALILDKGLEGWVLRERQPALVSDTKLDDRWLILPGHEEEDPVRSVISVPLAAGRGRIQGVLSLTHRYPDAFDRDDLNLAMSLGTQAAVAFENASLFQATQVALEETDALYRASRAVAAADNMDGIVRAIVDNLPSPQVDQCFLGIFDPSTSLLDELTIVAAWPQSGGPPLHPMSWSAGNRLSLAQDLIGETMSRDRPLVLSDVATETWLTEARRAKLLAAGVRSWAVIPLVAVGGWIGVLSVAASDSGAITEHNLQPYLTLAGQVALSIERSNLFKQTQEALEETSMLYRVSRAIGSAASIHEVADALIRSVSGSDFDRGLVLIRRHASDQLEVLTGWDRSGREVEVGALIDVSQVAPEPVIHPVSDEGLASDEVRGGDWRQVIGIEELAALASVPILFRSRLLGVLFLTHRSALSHAGGRPFTDQLSEEALQPFVTLAAQAAVTIENRRLFEETRRVAEEEAMLNEMLRNMATALDVWAVIRTVQDSLSQLVPFDRMNVALANEEMSALEVFHVGGDVDRHLPSEGQVVPLKETLIGQAIESGDTVVFDLTDQSLRGLEVEPLRQAGIQSIVILPLVYGRNVLGSLNLGHHHHDTYTTSDLPLLERVAQLMAVALENARLFDQVSQRALQLQTAADVSQSTTSILSLDHLLPQAVELIRERYDLYYVGIFLIDEASPARDEASEWAVLRAGTGEAGRLQLEQGHRLKVGGKSMVGWCVSHAQARIALDIGEEAVRFDNPFLPDTRSEMALPLISRGETIGALSVQSTQPAAFSQEDVTTLQTMADQLANAIQNARLYNEVQTAYARTREERDRLQLLHDTVVEIEQATTPEHKLELVVNGLKKVGYGRVVLTLRDAQMHVTYMVTAGMSEEEEAQLRESMESPDVWRQRMSGEFGRFRIGRCYYLPWSHPDAPVLTGKAPPDHQVPEPGALDADRWHPNDLLYVPLYDSASRLIGIINLEEPADGQRPTPDSLRVVGLFAQEAALSLENILLLRQAEEKARREALTRQITDKIRGSMDLESILQTTVTEVARALGTSHGAIRLGTPERLQSPSKEESEDGRESYPTSSPPPLSSSPAEDLADIPYPAGTEHSTSTAHSASTEHSASTGHPASAEPYQPGQVSAPPPEGAGKGGQEL